LKTINANIRKKGKELAQRKFFQDQIGKNEILFIHKKLLYKKDDSVNDSESEDIDKEHELFD